jgi:predicted DNA binding protein
MSVIAHLRIPAESFELGRILEIEGGTSIELESMIPLGETAVPFFSVHDGSQDNFEEEVRNHPSVDNLRTVTHHNGETLYALDWEVSRDLFFQGLRETQAHLLSGTGGPSTWEFEIRFPEHDFLSDFQEHCENAHISLEVGRIYNPTRPNSGPWYGLSQPQRETLVRAIQGGYYSIPRQMSTKDLADEFGISDQAVTERLRRAIITLVDNTLVAAMEERDDF